MAQVTINAHSSSADISSQNANWTTTRNAATGTTSADNIFIGAEKISDYYIYRWFGKFNLSSVPDPTKITAIDFKIYYNSRDTTNDFTLVTSTHTAPDTTLSTADFDSLTVNSPTEYSNRSANVSTFSAGYITFSLNATAITAAQAGGYFKIAVRSSRDVDNSTPTARSYVGFAASSSGNPPQIVVTYTDPSGSFYYMSV